MISEESHDLLVLATARVMSAPSVDYPVQVQRTAALALKVTSCVLDIMSPPQKTHAASRVSDS